MPISSMCLTVLILKIVLGIWHGVDENKSLWLFVRTWRRGQFVSLAVQ